MEMSLTNCWGCEPDFYAYGIATILLFVAPIGAFVLRKHIAGATGPWKFAGRLLQAAAALTLPFGILMIVTVVIGLLA